MKTYIYDGTMKDGQFKSGYRVRKMRTGDYEIEYLTNIAGLRDCTMRVSASDFESMVSYYERQDDGSDPIASACLEFANSSDIEKKYGKPIV